MADEIKAKAQILDYWRAIELFSPQGIPKVNPRDKYEPVIELIADSLPPWHPDHPLQRRSNDRELTWRHQVYCGIFELARVLKLLEDKVGRDPDSPDEYVMQESAVCTFTVTNNGQLLSNSLVISTCPWAAARTINPGPQDPGWLYGFDELSAKIASHFNKTPQIKQDASQLENLSPNEVEQLTTPILSAADVFREASKIIVELGAHAFIDHLAIRVKSYRISRRREEVADDNDSLNSFFINDLERVSSSVQSANLGDGLATLLRSRTPDIISKRIDVREDHVTTYDLLSPARFPQGCWPARNKASLFLSQQLAVNWIMAKFATNLGITSVNGPPGTGKTTLIRELIASVVVERAKRLAELKSPDQAFSGVVERWLDNGYTRSVSFWHHSLEGFELVVASTNNGAVENVVLEIPGRDAVDPDYTREDTYFASFAERLLDAPAWALIAARLGNKSNRSAFVNKFWYAGANQEQSGPGEKVIEKSNFLEYLKDKREGVFDWTIAVDRFKKAIQKETQLRNERLAVYQLAKTIPALRSCVSGLIREVDEAMDLRQAIMEDLSTAEATLDRNTKAIEATINDRLLHQNFRPGLWQIIFSLGKELRRWQGKDHALEMLVTELKAEQPKLMAAVVDIKTQLMTITAGIERLQRKWEAAETDLCEKLGQLDEARRWLGSYLLEPEMLDDAEARERIQPWSDPEWNEARTQVFIEALRLHKSFIHCNAHRFRNNLMVAMDILSGKVSTSITSAGAQHAWASLFFIIPVISTTFASFDRLFRHLKREQLGWLIIDEAGQAIPQAAVGAIWRAKRTVALGDPMQLEPVVTLPLSVQQALRLHYEVDKAWIPGQVSLQQLADEVNPVGSNVDLRYGSMWVGSPLRVHKRCDKPMFDISNTVAYGGQMVFDTPIREPMELRPSTWIDVVSDEVDGHWVPAEGVQVRQLLHEIFACNEDMDRILILSPFRTVARRLWDLTKSNENVQVGTIHIAQGKEADVVVLVLGGNPERPGAFRWASARPNMVNVAVSRAKRRLYIVGNKTLWSKYPYYGDLAHILDLHGNAN
ncbi:DEAD/DEAH box helicase [Candidatus Promineifilum breve]|uniref:DEAD/DEAH box helicase n=1 Tax=Candidatus Promineifilum breve TaxID=1806508 RepID=UPI00138FD784|nr:AAA domain-containing protein [Candidatus Promineifilum breve]